MLCTNVKIWDRVPYLQFCVVSSIWLSESTGRFHVRIDGKLGENVCLLSLFSNLRRWSVFPLLSELWCFFACLGCDLWPPKLLGTVTQTLPQSELIHSLLSDYTGHVRQSVLWDAETVLYGFGILGLAIAVPSVSFVLGVSSLFGRFVFLAPPSPPLLCSALLKLKGGSWTRFMLFDVEEATYLVRTMSDLVRRLGLTVSVGIMFAAFLTHAAEQLAIRWYLRGRDGGSQQRWRRVYGLSTNDELNELVRVL